MPSHSSPNFIQPDISVSDSLLIAFFIALVVHAIILLGVSFSLPEQQKVNKQIEITLAHTKVKKAPKKSNYLAQDNQLGAGKKTKKPTPPKQQLPSQGQSRLKPPKPVQQKQSSQPKIKQKRITQKQAEEKIVNQKPTPQTVAKRPKLSTEALQRQIAQLGAKIRHSQQASELTKIKFVNSVSTHKYLAAQYVADWEQKVEKVGNLNYPEVARKKGFSGSLTTDVGIKPDGSIYSIRVTKSSGIPALDLAAKRIIRLSAPFAALPKEILQELDVLVITRVWRFSDETGITTR